MARMVGIQGSGTVNNADAVAGWEKFATQMLAAMVVLAVLTILLSLSGR